MPLPKSPFGKLRQLNLRYREEDPNLPGLASMILQLPLGQRNELLMRCLYAGLEAHLAGEAMQQSPVPARDTVRPESAPQDPAPAEKTYSSAAEKMFMQWNN